MTRHDAVGIAIPILEWNPFFDYCLHSIFSQQFTGVAHVHIQHGGEDPYVERTIDRFVGFANTDKFKVTYKQAHDSGPANAINRAMAALDADTLTWLGSDDALMPGALQTVISLRTSHPRVQWLTGLAFKVDESGVTSPHFGSAGFFRSSSGFSRYALSRGLFGSQLNHDVIQQEGTFWSRSLWQKANGLDESLRLAFDFNLWCRFAQHEDLFEVMAPLAFFRKRSGQLSSDEYGYQIEVDRVKAHLIRPQTSAKTISFTKTNQVYWSGAEWTFESLRYLVLAESRFFGPLATSVLQIRVGLRRWLKSKASSNLVSRQIILWSARANERRRLRNARRTSIGTQG